MSNEQRVTHSVTMIHTVASLLPTFRDLAAELLPEVDVFHVVDESLLTVTRRSGRITPATRRRLLGYATSADDLGVDAILVTCSSVGPVVELIEPFVKAPILRVDSAMADQAIAHGPRIGVLATLDSTLQPTRELIETRARNRGLEVDVRAVVCAGAFEAVTAGDVERHDALVREGLLDLARERDIIVLAQASMARVLGRIPKDELSIPVLASPRLAVERLAAVLEMLG
jgi:Asp/Glu/hydantoin racemase